MSSMGRIKTKSRNILLGLSSSVVIRELLTRMPSGQTSARINVSVGRQLASTNKLREASELFARAIKSDEENDDCLYRLGMVEQRLNNVASARDLFTRAIGVNDDPKYRYHRSVTHALMGDYHRAVADLFRAASAERPDNRAMPKLWGLINSKKVSSVDRERYLIQGLHLGVGNDEWWLMLARMAFQRHDFSTSVKYFKRVLLQGRISKEDSYDYAVALNELGFRDEADTQFDDLVGQLPKLERTFGIGALHARKGNWPLAKIYYAKQIPELGTLSEFYYRAGMAHDRTYDWSGAEYYYTLAIVEDSNRPYWHWRLAFVLERQRKYAESAEHYFRSAELGGKHDGYYHAGRMHLAAGQKAEAVESFRLVGGLMTEPQGGGSRVGMAAKGQSRENRFPSLDRAKTPQNAHLFRTVGIELAREKKYSVALPYLSAAIKSLPEHDKIACYALGTALNALGHTQLGFEAYLRMNAIQRPDGVGNSIRLSPSEDLRCRYVAYREELPIDAEAVLYEVGHGSSISCNPLALYRAAKAAPEYSNLTHYWIVVDKTPIPEELLKDGQVVILERETDAYFRALATAKFLVNNTSFGSYFIRRKEQRYLNTWHGTPWKTLGKSVKGQPLAYGNISRNLMQATHVAVGNQWTVETLLKEHNVHEIFSGKIAVTGSPRNDVLRRSLEVAELNGIGALEIDGAGPLVVYVPTWHGSLGDDGLIEYDASVDLKVLHAIESAGCRVLYSAHRFVYEMALKAGLSSYLIPKDVDLYTVLKYADAIITDHSSVFIDFLVLDRPIVFYAPGIERYRHERGLYNLDLPGPLCITESQLVSEMSDVARGVDKYADERRTVASQFAGSEDGHAAKRVLAWFIEDKSEGIVIEPNSTSKAGLFRHSFIPNGIASSFRALARGLRSQRGLVPHVLVEPGSLLVDSGRQAQLDLLADNALVLPRSGAMLRSKEERWLEQKDRSNYSALSGDQRDVLMRGFEREYMRLFGEARFTVSCEFDGYSAFWTRVMGAAPNGTKRAIYMHNNMLEERTSKHPELHRVIPDYSNFDLLISVSGSVCEENREQLASRNELPVERFVWADNVVDSERVLAGASEPASAEATEFIDRASQLIVAVGRLSQEKGHDRLLKCLAHDNSNLHLLVVGGGPELESLRSLSYHLGLDDRVFFTGQVLNPYPLIVKASAVALLSRWEGQGLALLEAMILKRPIVATDIPGPRSIVNAFGGTLVSNDDVGVAKALQLIALDKLKTPEFDVDSYNQFAISKFRDLIEPPIRPTRERSSI